MVCRSLINLQQKNKRLFNDRVLRAIVYVSNRDITTFHLKTKQAPINWRDILVQAEFNHDRSVKEQDFSKTFQELGMLGDEKSG